MGGTSYLDIASFCALPPQWFSFSVFKSSLSPDPRQSLPETAFWCPGGLCHWPPLWDSSVPIVSALSSPCPSPSSRTLQSTNVPSNSSVLCLWTIQMYCPEMSGNARGYLFWFPSTVYAPFPRLSVGYLGYGQGRQWIGWELGWIPREAVEQGLVVSRMPNWVPD